MPTLINLFFAISLPLKTQGVIVQSAKVIARIIAVLIAVYMVFWLAIALYFSYAQSNKALLESTLERVFKRQVSIAEFNTEWNGFSPRFQLKGLRVEGDTTAMPALAVKSLSAELTGESLLRLWPKFREFALEQPQLEIVSLQGGGLQVAGIKLDNTGRKKTNPQRIVSWLTGQIGAAWVDGQIVWRRADGSEQRYQDIAFIYHKQNQDRDLKAKVITPKGALAFQAKAQGDPFSASGWNASLEVIGNQSQQLLKPEDLSLEVSDGQGQLRLKTLDIQRISDFLQLTGLANEAKWLLDAELFGRLHDVNFSFSGPLLKFSDWSLKASASDIGFKSVGRAPAINNLKGQLNASAQSGTFLFSTQDATFEWARWYGANFPIDRAMGEFSWVIQENGDVSIALKNGEFEDQNTRIHNLNATVEIDSAVRKINSFGQLFKVQSVADLSYQDGAVVEKSTITSRDASFSINPLLVDASAEFDVLEVQKIADYVPMHKSTELFKRWWSKAFVVGGVSGGKASYKGELSANAMRVGKAELIAQTDFSGVTLDYGFLQGWPIISKGNGVLKLNNDLLQILPTQAWLGPDKVTTADVKLTSLFSRERQVEVRGELTTELATFLDFLFKGPLVKPENRPDVLPVEPTGGTITTQIELIVPLLKVSTTTVTGKAQVNNASVNLPGGVPVSDIYADVDYTERSTASNNIRARFLDGNTQAVLTTVEEAQPPKLKLSASGPVRMQALEPWVGEHILTLLNGNSSYQGTILIDGPRIEVTANSDLKGVEVDTPAPLNKEATDISSMSLSMVLGSGSITPSLSLQYGEHLTAGFTANATNSNGARKGDLGGELNLFDRSEIRLANKNVGNQLHNELKEGVNFVVNDDNINLDEWLSLVLDLAAYQPRKPAQNTDFLDAMRSINIRAENPFFLNRDFGPLELSALSVDGNYWIGNIEGQHVEGTLQAQPRDLVSRYRLDLTRLNLVEESKNAPPLSPVDQQVLPSSYPAIVLSVDELRIDGRPFGELNLTGQPEGDVWSLTKFDLTHNGISTTAKGQWLNNKDSGTISSFDFDTQIQEAGEVLGDMEFDGFIRKGEGHFKGNVNWIGAPHEFDYSRLNGNFDLNISEGELVKVDAGSGKLIGLFNFNAIARRLVFDFRDVFASGLQFDRMIYTGVFADGEAIMNDALILSPAVFVRMEGKVDLANEMVDMEVHVSPELGGNLALFSALANPAAGAVVYLTQRIFKNQLRNARFRSYRALGTWEDFELVDFDPDQQAQADASNQVDGSAVIDAANEDAAEAPNEDIAEAPSAAETLEPKKDSLKNNSAEALPEAAQAPTTEPLVPEQQNSQTEDSELEQIDQ